MAKGRLFDLVRGYTSSDVDHNGKKFYVKTVTGSSGSTSITRFGRMFTHFCDRATNLVSYTETRIYGCFFTILGLLSLIVNFVKDYLGYYSDGIPLPSLIVSILVAFLGIPFLFSDKPLAIVVQDIPITDFIFFEFFCIRRMHRYNKEKGIHPAIAIVVGILLSALTIVVPVWIIAAILATFVYLFLTFLSPEFSFFSIFLAMPYLSFDDKGIFLAIMVAITLVSYCRKVRLGKRVYFFEQYDVSLAIMLLCILISGIFVKGVESFVSSVVMILLGMGYVLASSLVTNRRLADCLINVIIISSIPVAFIAIGESIQFIYLNGYATFEGATATFEKAHTLAIFLLISSAMSIYFVNTARSKTSKILYFTAFLVTFVAIFFTNSLWAYVAALFGLLAYGILKLRRGWRVLLLFITAAPYAALFMPAQYVDIVINHPLCIQFGLSESMIVWRTAMTMLRNNLFLGIGIGEECFVEEISQYTDATGILSSGNFLLEIACEAGIISLCAFALILLIRLKHRAIYRPYIRTSQVSALSEITTVSVIMLMVYGVFNYIWSDMTMYYLFWCVFGIGSAVLRISKQEFDDRVAYFSDGSAEDSSSIDITIR